jgi:phage terminase large subunit
MFADFPPVFHNTLLAWKQGYKDVVNQGGTSSSKTFNQNIANAVICASEPNTVFTVTGRSVPFIKRGALQDFQQALNLYPVLQHYIKQYNITDRTYTFRNGSTLQFSVFPTASDAKGAKRDYLFMNEADSIPYEIAHHLMIRTSKTRFYDYNPTAAFWIHDHLLNKDTTRLIISDHRHNPFLSEAQHNEIENHPDPEWHKVYARGLTGNITGIVFPNWKQMEGEEWRSEVKGIIYGIDYGYTNDPTCILKIYILSKHEVVLEELMYTPSSDDEFISEVLFKSGYSPESCVYADHDKVVNSQLQRRNINIHNAVKIDRAFAIQKIRGIQVWYTPNSVNVHKERSRYVFKKTNDIVTGIPDETGANHAMHSAIYGIYTHFLRNQLFI